MSVDPEAIRRRGRAFGLSVEEIEDAVFYALIEEEEMADLRDGVVWRYKGYTYKPHTIRTDPDEPDETHHDVIAPDGSAIWIDYSSRYRTIGLDAFRQWVDMDCPRRGDVNGRGPFTETILARMWDAVQTHGSQTLDEHRIIWKLLDLQNL